MHLLEWEEQKTANWEQLRLIEDELFLLSEGSAERNFESRRYFQRLCGERTQLARKLLLTQIR
jgi:hypothetical protein